MHINGLYYDYMFHIHVLHLSISISTRYSHNMQEIQQLGLYATEEVTESL